MKNHIKFTALALALSLVLPIASFGDDSTKCDNTQGLCFTYIPSTSTLWWHFTKIEFYCDGSNTPTSVAVHTKDGKPKMVQTKCSKTNLLTLACAMTWESDTCNYRYNILPSKDGSVVDIKDGSTWKAYSKWGGVLKLYCVKGQKNCPPQPKAD